MTDRPMTTRPGSRPTPGRARAADPAAGASAGFTIAELIVAVVLTALLGAGIVGLLLGQNRFYETNEQTLYADESRRGTGELMASELRMLASEDLYKAEKNEVKGRFDVRRMVVCSVDALTEVVTLFVYDEPGITLPSGVTGTAHSSPFDGSFVYADGWSPSLNSIGVESTCTANGGPGGYDAARYRAVSWSGHPVGLPDKGAIVRVYGDLSYSFQPATSGDGLALWRNGQELAAPFADDGATFRYIMDNGNKEVSVPNPKDKNIVSVRVEATATGQGANRFDVAQDLQFDIPFRN